MGQERGSVRKAGRGFPRKAATGTVADEDGWETRKPSVEPGLTNRLESLECDEGAIAVDSTCKQATVAQPSCAGTR